MSQCYKSGDFWKYFNENMKALKLPVPTTLFSTFERAINTVITILVAVDTLGKGATIAEIVGATIGLEKLKVVGSLVASYYVGAVIGSIAVAIGRSSGCGHDISDIFILLQKYKLKFDDYRSFYQKNPEILDRSHPNRSKYRSKALLPRLGSPGRMY